MSYLKSKKYLLYLLFFILPLLFFFSGSVHAQTKLDVATANSPYDQPASFSSSTGTVTGGNTTTATRPPTTTAAGNSTPAGSTTAAKTDDKKKDKKNKDYPDGIDSGLERICYDFIKGTLNINLGKDMQNIIAGKSIKQVMNPLKKLYDTVKPVGMSLIVLYFLIEVIDKTTKENFSLEQFFRLMLKLLFAKLLMDDGWTILNSLINIGNAFTGFMSVENTALSASMKSYAEEIDDANIIGEIAIMIQWLIPWLFSFICRLISQVICWGRTIEIGLRTVGAPVAMADIFQDGMHGGGFRYLKKYFAVCLQAFIIMVIIQVSGIVQSIIIGDGGVTMINAVIVGLTTCMMVIRSQQFANDMVGV